MNAFKIVVALSLLGCTPGFGQGAACAMDEQCGRGLSCRRQLCMRNDETRILWSPDGGVIPPGAVVDMHAAVVNPHVLDGSVPLSVQGASMLEGNTIHVGTGPVTVVGPELGKRAFFDVVPHAVTLLAGALGGPGRAEGTSAEARIPLATGAAVSDGDRVVLLSDEGIGVFDPLAQTWHMLPGVDVRGVVSIEADDADAVLLRSAKGVRRLSLMDARITDIEELDAVDLMQRRHPGVPVARDRLQSNVVYALLPTGVVRSDGMLLPCNTGLEPGTLQVAGTHAWSLRSDGIYTLDLAGDCTPARTLQSSQIAAIAVQDENRLYYYERGVLRSREADGTERDLAGVAVDTSILAGGGDIGVRDDGRVYLFEGTKVRELAADGSLMTLSDNTPPAAHHAFWNGGFVSSAAPLAASDKRLFSLEAGAILVRSKDGSSATFAVGDTWAHAAVAANRLLVTSAKTWQVYDTDTGAVVWTRPAPFEARAAAAADDASVWLAADRSIHKVFLDGLGSVRFLGDDHTAKVVLGAAPAPVSKPWQLARARDGALLIYDRNEAALLRFAPKAK